MDKIFTSLIIGLLCCVSQLSAQQPTFTITPQTANAQVNDIIEFDVEVSNFNNIATFQYGINWNPAILEFVDISSINASGTTGFPALSDPPNGNFRRSFAIRLPNPVTIQYSLLSLTECRLSEGVISSRLARSAIHSFRRLFGTG